MNSLQLDVGLSAWIIQDGNYDDFQSGTTARFALEFYAEHPLTSVPPRAELLHTNDAHYRASGRVCFVTREAWVVDWGGILAFREEKPPRFAKLGSYVSGEIDLGIDPFFYFEYLFKLPEMPPLIYEWQIDSIAMETAPFVDGRDARGTPLQIRDRTKRRRVFVPKTDAWHDDGGNGDYVLRCKRTSSDPSHRLPGNS